jgi:NADPH:quinone reductase-like Zn-dependent oxidoreductase
MTKTARFAEYGDPDALRIIDVPAPTAGQGQVRVAVRAAGVNPIDAKTVEGLMRNEIPLTLPAGVGADVSGLVDQVGPGVSEFAVGDEVLGSSVTPSFAEYALAEPTSLVRKPHDIAWEVAGSLAGAGGTAYAVLKSRTP